MESTILLNSQSSDKLLLSGNKPDQLYNNCAGKHLAMISTCLINNLNVNTYVKMNHPHQKIVRKYLEFFTETKINKNSKKELMDVVLLNMLFLLKTYL